MATRTIFIMLASVLGFVFTGGPARLAAEDEIAPPATVRIYQGIAYATGGVGAGEREKLEAMKTSFSLKLVFAAKGGPFLGDATVEIQDESGNKVFEGRSDGPWFFLKLQPGSYRVRATNEGKTFEQKARVGETGLVELHFYWQRSM